MSFKQELFALLRKLRGGETSPRQWALSVALGLFVGCLPVFGFHLFLTTGLSLAFGLDALIAYAAANISVPPMIPLLLYAELQVGTYLMSGAWHSFSLADMQVEQAGQLGLALVLGALVVGAAVSLVGAGVTWLIAFRVMKRKTHES